MNLWENCKTNCFVLKQLLIFSIHILCIMYHGWHIWSLFFIVSTCTSKNIYIYIHVHRLYTVRTTLQKIKLLWNLTFWGCFSLCDTKGGPGGGEGRGHPARAPPIIEKNMIFLHKIVIFHTKYPKYFHASLCSARFFKCAPPNLKSWIPTKKLPNSTVKPV